jgi:integrase
MEVAKIRTGVATREELEKADAPKVTLAEALERFLTKMVADDDTARHITRTKRNITRILNDCDVKFVVDIRRETVERWIANERQRGTRNPRTINGYITSLKTFVQYLTEIGTLPNHPLKSIRKLNEEIDKRINRRALTKDEIKRLLKATVSGIDRAAGTPEERVLIYRTALATGLRSTELSLLTPSQINFEQCSLTVEAAKTKNKKPDVLPLRADLVQSLKERCETKGIKPHERFFRHDVYNIRKAFYADLKIAGIERVGEDGRSIDVHSLRKTFGTLLAKAGVPLTTVQRLMRHSSPLLTAKLYIDVEGGDMMDALDKLPEFSFD